MKKFFDIKFDDVCSMTLAAITLYLFMPVYSIIAMLIGVFLGNRMYKLWIKPMFMKDE